MSTWRVHRDGVPCVDCGEPIYRGDYCERVDDGWTCCSCSPDDEATEETA